LESCGEPQRPHAQRIYLFRSNIFGPTYVFAVEVANAAAQPAE
jgi:hypothetical protein